MAPWDVYRGGSVRRAEGRGAGEIVVSAPVLALALVSACALSWACGEAPAEVVPTPPPVDAEAQVIVVDYATANPENSAHVQHIRKFAQLLEAYSQGRLRLRMHVGGVKGSEQDNAMDVSSGELHMSTLAVNNVTSFAPAVGLVACTRSGCVGASG